MKTKRYKIQSRGFYEGQGIFQDEIGITSEGRDLQNMSKKQAEEEAEIMNQAFNAIVNDPSSTEKDFECETEYIFVEAENA